MNLRKPSLCYKPFRYPWAFEIFCKSERMHWLAEEVSLQNDLQDWKILPEHEKNILTQIFRFFTQADMIVNNAYNDIFIPFFKPVEVRMMLSSFSNREAIHIRAYSYLIDTVGMPEAEYSAFLQYAEMSSKFDYLLNFNTNNNFETARAIAAFSAFTEGLQLFTTFAILLSFGQVGKMGGMCQIITWSMRDEALHVESMITLFRQFLSENIDINKKELFTSIDKICVDIVESEIKFVDLILGIGNPPNLNKEMLISYIKYMANLRLKGLGLTRNSFENYTKNPLEWLCYSTGSEFANFFESTPTEYAKSSTDGEWDKVF